MGGSTAPAGVLRGQRPVGSVRLCRCVGAPQACVAVVGSCEVSLRALTSALSRKGRPSYKAGIVNGRCQRGKRTAALAAYLNKALHLTASSVRSCLASASSSS